mgnify:CR=1 FL=1
MPLNLELLKITLESWRFKTMLVKELYMTRADGVRLYRTYSDADKMILQNETNSVYSEAIDIEDALFTYTETDINIEY